MPVRKTTEKFAALDVRRLQREGNLVPGSTFGWSWSRGGSEIASFHGCAAEDHVSLSYRVFTNGKWIDGECSVQLARTPCHFGNTRAWFHCPACQRRVAILYLGSTLACRHCHRLTYECQREARHYRAGRRADKVAARLRWDPGIFNKPSFEKPHGMRWRTFHRLVEEREALVQSAYEDINRWVDRVKKALERSSTGK